MKSEHGELVELESSNKTTAKNWQEHRDFKGEPCFRRVLYTDRYTPACTKHGAMNRVAEHSDWWRCLACNLGVEWTRPDA